MRLDSFGSDNQKRLLLGAVAAVAVGAVVLVVALNLRGPSLSPRPEEVHFVCDKCGGHFAVKIRDLPPGYMHDRLQPDGQAAIDCTRCGGKKTAYLAFRCRDPDCGKHYLTEWSRHPAGPTAAQLKRGVKWDNKCPHCGTDPAEWDRKHRGQ